MTPAHESVTEHRGFDIFYAGIVLTEVSCLKVMISNIDKEVEL
jgi:hypothetical protein